MKKTMYRVGVPWTEFPEDGFTYLIADSDPTDTQTFDPDGCAAALYDAKTMSTWVQVLASRYEYVVVERVEVANV